MSGNTSATGGFLKPNPTPPNPAPLQDAALTDFFQQHIVGMTNIPGDLVRPRWQPQPPPHPPVDADWCAVGIYDRPADSFPEVTHLALTYGQLMGGTLLPAERDPAAWGNVLDGSFVITFQGGDPIAVANLDFSGCTSMEQIAELVTVRMSAQTANANCAWVKDHFEITSLTLGQTILPLTELGEGTDISVRLMCSADTLRAYIDAQAGADEVRYNEEMRFLCSFYGPNADNNASLIKAGLAVAQNREPMQLLGMNLVEVQEGVAVPSQINNKWYYRVDQFIRFRRQIRRTYPVLNLLSAGVDLDAGNIEIPIVIQNTEA